MKKDKLIKPQRDKCDCGKKVKNHHWLCDKCWGGKAKDLYYKVKKKLLKNKKNDYYLK